MQRAALCLAGILIGLLLGPSQSLATEPNAPLVSEEDRRLLEAALNADSQPSLAEAKPSATSAPKQGAFASTNPQMALILDVAGAWFSESESLQMGAHDPRATGFTFQQLEMHLASKVDPFFEFEANLVFSRFGVEIEEAYARTLALPHALQVRAGQYLLPFGRLNPTHPHAWHFLDQALMLGKFMGSEGGRGLGVEVSWLAPLPWYAKATFSATQPAGECCSRSFSVAANEPINGPEDLLYTGRMEQFWDVNDDWAVLLGASGMMGENKTGLKNATFISGADLLIRYRPLHSPLRQAFALQFEWMQRNRQVPSDELKDAAWHLEARATWSPEWESALRWEWVEGVTNDPLDAHWTQRRMRNSGQITWRPSHFSRIRFQVANDSPLWANDSIWSAMLGLEVVTGAHSAHSY